MAFKKLNISEWKQFHKIEIEFHERLTILTGANASGKTTILKLLANSFGLNHRECSTPAKDPVSGKFKYFTRFFKEPFQGEIPQIGFLEFDDEQKVALRIPANNTPLYSIQINQKGHEGFFIPSHRSEYEYKNVSQLPTRKKEKREAFYSVYTIMKEKANQNQLQVPANYYIKETLLTWAIYGYGNPVVESEPEQLKYLNEFQKILQQLLPKSLGFKEIAIRKYEVVLITDSGDFMLDAVSGGLATLIDLAWLIYNFPSKNSFTVIIDEIENHLYAVLQRQILPKLIASFPHVQFIVSTHNPLIIGSVKDSYVYALKYDEKNKIFSEYLDLVNKPKGAADILREILGVSFTMPIWVEERLNEIVNKYSSTKLNNDDMDNMRKELTELGLADLVPETIVKVVEKNGKTSKN